MTIQWTQDLSVGIQVIDNQHKEFFHLLNELYEASNNLNLTKELPLIMEKITKYAGYHFATEEEYFEKFQYPKAAAHIEQHQIISARLEKLKNSKQDIGRIAEELMELLEDWFTNHIYIYDKEYSDYFHQHGLV